MLKTGLTKLVRRESRAGRSNEELVRRESRAGRSNKARPPWCDYKTVGVKIPTFLISKGQWKNLKRADARFSIFPLAFELLKSLFFSYAAVEGTFRRGTPYILRSRIKEGPFCPQNCNISGGYPPDKSPIKTKADLPGVREAIWIQARTQTAYLATNQPGHQVFFE